jgi:predicted adenylyl cyclase CyaB
MLEQEIKLAFDSVAAARRAVSAAGGRLVHPRRLLDDCLFDTADALLKRAGSGLRLRRDGSRAFLAVKGPVQPGPVKTREELESGVADAAVVAAMLESLGFRAVFRSQKYREEYAAGATKIAIDETPAGVFVEIEGVPEDIGRVSLTMGRTPADFRLESYSALWQEWCADRGVARCDMLFDPPATGT